MSIVNNRPPAWEGFPPIQSWAGQVFNHKNSIVYDVEKAVKMITLSPRDFQFGMVRFQSFRSLLDGRGNYDEAHIRTMSEEDSWRPVLFASLPDGTTRLIDGYHRAIHILLQGFEGVPAWVLSVEQTDAITYPYTPDIEAVP